MGAHYWVRAANRADDPPKVPSRRAAGHLARCSFACHSLCRPLARLPTTRQLAYFAASSHKTGVLPTTRFAALPPAIGHGATGMVCRRGGTKTRISPTTRFFVHRVDSLAAQSPGQAVPVYKNDPIPLASAALPLEAAALSRAGRLVWGTSARWVFGLFRRPSGHADMNTASSAADAAKMTAAQSSAGSQAG